MDLASPTFRLLVLIILLLFFRLCMFNLFQRFLQDQVGAISLDQVKTVLLFQSLTSSLDSKDLEP